MILFKKLMIYFLEELLTIVQFYSNDFPNKNWKMSIFVELCKGHNSTALIGFRCLSWGVAILVLCLYCSLKHKCTRIARFFAMIVSSLAFILTFFYRDSSRASHPTLQAPESRLLQRLLWKKCRCQNPRPDCWKMPLSWPKTIPLIFQQRILNQKLYIVQCPKHKQA